MICTECLSFICLFFLISIFVLFYLFRNAINDVKRQNEEEEKRRRGEEEKHKENIGKRLRNIILVSNIALQGANRPAMVLVRRYSPTQKLPAAFWAVLTR